MKGHPLRKFVSTIPEPLFDGEDEQTQGTISPEGVRHPWPGVARALTH